MIERNKFAEKVKKELVKAGWPEPLTYDPEAFTIKSPSGGQMYLHNAYQYYSKAGFFERGKVLQQFIQPPTSLPSVSSTFEDARPKLVPLIRSSIYLGHLDHMAWERGQGALSAFRPITPYTAIALGQDGERTVSLVNRSSLEEWGTSLDEALKAARFNVRMMNPTPFQLIAPGLYVSACQDYYDAARLVLTEVINRLELKGAPVAAVPNPNRLFITGSEDDDGLVMLSELLAKGMEDPKWISGELLLLDGEQWRPFMVPAGHPAAAALANAKIQTEMAAYEEQKPRLEQRFEKEERAAFVASFKAVQNEDGEISSYSVWAKGVETLLPKTDRIAIMSELDGKPAFVPWEQVQAVIGDQMQPQGLFPERYRVTQFPTEEQLAKLRAS